MNYSRQDLTNNFFPFSDSKLTNIKNNWYSNSAKIFSRKEFCDKADQWFKSTTLNQLHGWKEFSCVDFTFGCTHFIESTAARYNWNIQVLPWEYSLYKLMGIQQTLPGELTPNIPLFITLPNWHFADIRPEWPSIISECDEKNIDIHIDFAWIITAKDIEIDLNHKCIKSFAMSISKYNMQWNRCGIRWSRQRTMDSITIENQYYVGSNDNISSAGVLFLDNIPQDYLWNTYQDLNYEVCNQLNLTPTKIFHVAIDNDTGNKVGIGKILNRLVR